MHYARCIGQPCLQQVGGACAGSRWHGPALQQASGAASVDRLTDELSGSLSIPGMPCRDQPFCGLQPAPPLRCLQKQVAQAPEGLKSGGVHGTRPAVLSHFA